MATVTPAKRESDAGLMLARAVVFIAVFIFCVAQYAGAKSADESNSIPDRPVANAQ